MAEAIAEIITALRAVQEIRHLRIENRFDNQIYIYGNYDLIAVLTPLWFPKRIAIDTRASGLLYEHSVAPDLSECVKTIIEIANNEERPEESLEIQFYKKNFPCLAEEVDYSYYKEYHPYVNDAARGNILNGLVLEQLNHFDYSAFKRKMHGAIDGIRLPLPIRDAIIGAFDAEQPSSTVMLKTVWH